MQVVLLDSGRNVGLFLQGGLSRITLFGNNYPTKICVATGVQNNFMYFQRTSELEDWLSLIVDRSADSCKDTPASVSLFVAMLEPLLTRGRDRMTVPIERHVAVYR